jgi:integrase/recombinase XerD
MSNAGVTPTTFNARIVALRFFFATTCGREEMMRHMQFRRQPRKLPVVLSIEEFSDLLMAAPGPGLKYRAGTQHLLWAPDCALPRSATSRSATSTATGC